MSFRGDSSRTRHALRGLLGEILFTIRDSVEVASKVAENAARTTRTWNDETGKTRKTIRASSIKGGFGFKLVGKGKSLFLEEGTTAHVITANKKKFLKFKVGGQTVFRRSVFHPGQKATHFLHEAVVEASEVLIRNLPGLIERAAKKRGL